MRVSSTGRHGFRSRPVRIFASMMIWTIALAADRRGVSVEALAREALERAVDYDDWFIREVEKGLA